MAVEPRISKYLFAKASKSKIPLSGTFLHVVIWIAECAMLEKQNKR